MKMKVLGLFSLLSLCQISHGIASISGYVQVSVTVLSYLQQNDNVYDNVARCDYTIQNKPSCDLGFVFCLDPVTVARPTDPTVCLTKPGKTGQVIKDSNSFTFANPKTYGNFTTPYNRIYENGWHGSFFKVLSQDFDFVTSELIDKFRIIISPSTVNLGTGRYKFPVAKGMRPNKPASLEFAVEVTCPLGISGTDCIAAPQVPTAAPTAAPVTPYPLTVNGMWDSQTRIYLMGKYNGADDLGNLNDNAAQAIRLGYNSDIGDVTASGAVRFGVVKDTSNVVTEFAFTATVDKVELTGSAIETAFRALGSAALTDTIAKKLSIQPLQLLPPKGVDMTPPPLYVTYWPYLAGAGGVLLVLVFIMVGLCCCICVERRRRSTLLALIRKQEAALWAEKERSQGLAKSKPLSLAVRPEPHAQPAAPSPIVAPPQKPRDRVLLYDEQDTLPAFRRPTYGPNGDAVRDGRELY